MKSSPAVSLLLTNLQLLDYYSSEDAFPISVETFTSLKNKGKAFEHIVHHLFQVYQPNEAATRFQGCWPIYEPVQSRELRNVVFKWLTDLKRSGLLQTGGNVIIRRSLFDDCSGERYEELLLALSTMVLRNQVERGVFKEPKHQTIAYKQCHTHTPNLGLLTPLILAHQSSLTRLLNSRNNSKEQWRLFVSFLKQREAELELSASHLPPDAANLEGNSQQEEDIIAKWKNNWLGDTRWLDILFDGNSDGRRDKLLESGYDRAFAKYKNISQEGSGKASSASGLVGLERQVEEQRTRVGELRKLRESAMKSLAEIKGTELELQSDESPETKDTPKGLGVIFSRHANLRIKPEESTSRASAIPANDADDGNEYSILLEDLRAELEAVDSAKRKRKTRPIVTPFRPPILDNGIEHLARKTLLPQPASKVSRPGTLLPKASSSYLSGRAAGVPGTKPVANTPPTPVPASDPQSPKLQKNIFGTALPKTPPGLEEDEIDFAAFARTPNTNAEKVVEKKLMFDSALPKLPPPRSIPRSNSLKSPERMQLRSRDSSNNLTNKSPERLQLRSKDSTSNMSLKSPERMQLRPRDSASNLALKSPDRIPLPSRESSSNPSPTPSDEQFSEIDDSVLMTPHRSRATTRTPLTSQSSSTSQSTPKAARTLSYGGDEELTPRALRYSSTPRTGTAPKLSAGFEDSEIAADKIVSRITNLSYSPERSPTRYSPEKATPLRTNSSPTRTARFGFGFRSPDVSPIKGNATGFNVLEHSTLLSLGTPASASSTQSPHSSNIPHHPSSLEYKPLSHSQSSSRLQHPSIHLSSPQGQSSPSHRQLNIDVANTAPIRPLSAETTPQEELLVSEDYSSVFKSRPKIALSPPFAPIAQPGLGTRQGSSKSRMSPDFMSLNSAASASGSEDGGDWARDTRESPVSAFGYGRSPGLAAPNRPSRGRGSKK